MIDPYLFALALAATFAAHRAYRALADLGALDLVPAIAGGIGLALAAQVLARGLLA